MNKQIFFNKKLMDGLLLVGVFSLFALTINSVFVVAVTPSGATPVEIANSSAPPDDPQSVSAQAGNVTELNIVGYTTTQSWTGYYGNVSGVIQLADAGDNVMYNWSLASPEGEIYASTSDSISWGSLECFNYSLNGTWLENNFSINESDVDGVNETFSWDNGHDLFYSNSQEFTEGQCMSTTIYDNSGAGVDNNFEEVLLYDGDNVIFASILEEADTLGFDGKNHDFEMLVLENGHETDLDPTTYYFYVELQ